MKNKNKMIRDFLLFLGLAMFFVAVYYVYVPTTVDGRYSLAQILDLPFTSNSLEAADTSLSGVTVYNKEKAYDGYNFYTGKLIDMDGRIIRPMGKMNNFTHDTFSVDALEAAKGNKSVFYSDLGDGTYGIARTV